MIDGYPGDYTKEWATNGQGAGAWLKLTWSSVYVVDKVVLYDRPNLNDQILSATLTFNDGSTVQVGPLDNAGAATVVTFAPKSISQMTMTVNTVSGTTQNIGLAEIQVYGSTSSGESCAGCQCRNRSDGPRGCPGYPGWYGQYGPGWRCS